MKNLNTEDLNSIKKAGFYAQPANANCTPARNYPEQQAGSLEVRPSTYGWQQEYTVFSSGKKYVRNSFSGGNFSPWFRVDALDLHDLFVGVPIPYPLSAVPEGCLAMNGQRFDKARYPKLAQKYPSGQLPDLRGEFIRGLDNGRGVDAGRALLSNQTDKTKEAFFEFQTLDIADSNISNVRGDARQETWQWNSTSNNWEKIDSNKYNSYSINGITTSGGFRELQANDMFKKFWIGSGTETRPRNIAFHYICLAA